MQKNSKIGHFRAAIFPRNCELLKGFRSLSIRHLSLVLETLRVGALPPLQNVLPIFELDLPFRKKWHCDISKFAHTIFPKLCSVVESVVLSGKIAKKRGVKRADFEGWSVENSYSSLNNA